MLVNPLFAKDEDEDKPAHHGKGYAFRNHKGKTLQPISKDLSLPPHARPISLSPHHHAAKTHSHKQAEHQAHVSTHHTPDHSDHGTKGPKSSATAAIELIRSKVAALYDQEPDAKQEIQQVATPASPLTKHQQFMQSLSTSGKSLARIQTEWHAYYLALPDDEKHEVWREFYQANARGTGAQGTMQQNQAGHTAQAPVSHPANVVVSRPLPEMPHQPKRDRRGTARIRKRIINSVGMSAAAQAKAKQHFQSLAFGITTGFLVLVIFLFGFFNEMFIAPFIQPSRHVSATPIIVSSASVAASDTPEVIIPKINVQIPVVYDQKSIKEEDIQGGLERGVVHYPTTVLPGQQGNTAFFGHSSNNIFNKGKYKFAFVLLRELQPGDTFYLTYGKTVYSYRVFDKKIVPPTEVSVLGNVPGKVATAALITCDPPGTSTNRLVVWGEQISPDPTGAAAPTAPGVDQSTPVVELPSEGPTLWKRFTDWLF